MAQSIKMDESENTKPRMGELAVAGNDILNSFGYSSDNPDEIIASKGMEYIEKIEKDTHISSQLKLRRQKLIKKGYRIKPAEKNGKVTAKALEIADFIQWNLDAMDGSFLKDIEAMLDAVSKGFSLSEINYTTIAKGKWNGKVGLKSLRFKPAKYFAFKFDKYGHYEPLQIDPDISGTPLPLNKFIHLISGNNDENPYGDGVTSKCAFWSWLKTNIAKFNAIFSEKFGMPTIQVGLPANPKDTDETKAREIINYFYKTNGVVVPYGFAIELLEAKRSGSAEYDISVERCNKEMSKEINSATLISEEGKRGQGSYALGHEHAGILDDNIVFDGVMTANAINEQLIRRLVDYNFVTEEYPQFEWIGISVESFISFAQGIGVLVDKGVEIAESYVYDQTGIPRPRPGEKILKASAPAINQSKIQGTDNRSFHFAENGEDPELEKLLERYINRSGSVWDAFKGKLQSLKKKN